MIAQYGSDKNGLICGYLFKGSAAGVPVDLEAALAWLRSDAAIGDGFV